MAKLDELLKAFRSREGIKGTNVAKMMSRKEAGNYTTIGSRVSNPFSHPKYNVSSIGRDKHYFLLNRYEKDIAKDLIKSLTHVIKNNISLSSKQKKNVYDNYDMLVQLQRANKKSEDILIKDGKNPLDVIAAEQAKVKPSQLSSDLTEKSPDLFKDLEDLNKTMKDMDDAAKNLEESGMGLETEMQKIKKASDDLKKSLEDPLDEVGRAERREKHKFMNTGKEYWKNEAYNRAVGRKLLLHLDKNGIIKLTDKVRDSLKNYDDLRGGGTAIHVPDPIRVLREHIKPASTSDMDTIFDILPQGLDEVSASKPGVFDDVVKRLKTDKKKWRDAGKESDASIAGTYEGPIWKEETKWQIKPKIGEAEEYFNPTEFQNRINYEKETLAMIKRGESAYGSDLKDDRLLQGIKMYEDRIKKLEEARIRVYPEFKGPFPKVDPANTNFIMHSIDESWGPHGGDINRIGRHKMKTKVDKETGESTSVSWDTFDEKTGKFFEKESDYKFNKAYKGNEEVDIKPVDTKEGIESLKVISEGDEGFDEISEKLGITARPGFPVTETGKADLKLVKPSTKDEKFRAQLKAKLINLPEFKKTNMTEADMDFVLKDVRADLGMDESYQTVLKNAKLLDEQKKKKNMDEAWNEATKDFPTSGNVDDIKKWLKDKETKTTTGPEVSGIDDLLKSDFEKATKVKKRDALNIRIMKNFDQPLDDIALGKEGYNLQEINVLKNARKRLESGEETHPNEALLREKELLADEAGVDVDELTLSIDWGDFTPDSFATGGGVGYFMGSGSGELTDILERLKMVTQGEGMYSNWNHANRKSLQRALTSRANALLGN